MPDLSAAVKPGIVAIVKATRKVLGPSKDCRPSGRSTPARLWHEKLILGTVGSFLCSAARFLKLDIGFGRAVVGKPDRAAVSRQFVMFRLVIIVPIKLYQFDFK